MSIALRIRGEHVAQPAGDDGNRDLKAWVMRRKNVVCTRGYTRPVPPRSPWVETSRAEKNLALALASSISKENPSQQDEIYFVELIGRAVANGDLSLLRDFNLGPASLTLHRWFASGDSGISTNFIAALAREFGRAAGIHDDAGVVDTPPTLARDMVSLAAMYWLSAPSGNTELDASLIEELFTSSTGIKTLSSATAERLKKASWYDPCVGGGVFPLAVLDLLQQAGAVNDSTVLDYILCRDTDPYAIAATRVRLALSIAQMTREGYEDAFQHATDRVRLQNSLDRYAEQPSIDFCSEEDEDESPVDIVVGNPPYVRADRLSRSTKERLTHLFPSIYGGQVDLSNYFVAHGIQALKPGGVLCYVSSASFQRSRYGEKLRAFIASNGTVMCVFDLDELPVFSDASIHTSVYAISRTKSPGVIRTFTFKELPSTAPLRLALVHSSAVPATSLGRGGWNIGRPERKEALDLIENAGTNLEVYAGEIYSGIKTGHKDAFILTGEDAARLLSDELSAPFIKRMLRPVSIRRWRSNWDESYMAVVPKGQSLHVDSLLYRHLLKYEESLRSRTDTQHHPTWYGLRHCSYYPLFSAPKLVFPDIASECRFAIDDKRFVIPDGAFFISVADDFLVAILNSCVGQFYFGMRCNSIGNPQTGGRLRFKKTFVKSFPVPKTPDVIVDELRDLGYLMRSADSVDHQNRIDELALKAFAIPTSLESVIVGGA